MLEGRKRDLTSLTRSSTDRSAHSVKITTPTQHNPKPNLTLVSTFVIGFPVPAEDSGSHPAAADSVLMLHTKLQSIADLGGGGEKQVC